MEVKIDPRTPRQGGKGHPRLMQLRWTIPQIVFLGQKNTKKDKKHENGGGTGKGVLYGHTDTAQGWASKRKRSFGRHLGTQVGFSYDLVIFLMIFSCFWWFSHFFDDFQNFSPFQLKSRSKSWFSRLFWWFPRGSPGKPRNSTAKTRGKLPEVIEFGVLFWGGTPQRSPWRSKRHLEGQKDTWRVKKTLGGSKFAVM